MIKTLGNPENKRYIGNTAGLIKLQSQGMILRYEVQTGSPEYAVEYLPRSKSDPMPWVQVGGLESRLRSTEIVAWAPQVFAAWEAEKDAETDEWIASIDRSLSPKPVNITDQQDALNRKEAGVKLSPRYVVQPYDRRSRFAVYDTVTELDADNYSSRYAAQDKADRLNESVAAVRDDEVTPMDAPADCPTHGIDDLRGGRAAEIDVTACASSTTYGAWSEGAGGFIFSGDCALEVANWSADELRKLAKEDDTDTIQVLAVCREHDDQPATGCEECDSEN